ncbi:TPA: restriction endonuclease subunit S [Streptococcus suis]|nr:restriction endonuclease subunit S [Streptococcus suis]HEM3693330.1 restriction endonuclease subunit S [Streptococcus suis]
MNHIEKMLQDYCPNGVEWKELGEVCEIQRGVRITKKQLLPSGYPVVSGGTGYMGYTDNYNREAETITIAQYGVAGYVNIQKEKFWANDVCFSVYPKDILVNKYLYYVLANKQEYLYSISNRTAVPYSISKDKILKIKIPIPPLEIQEEIVKILDKFTEYVTELTAELTAELTLRQKQYNYFRDYLLNFDSDSSGGANNKVYQVEWKTLGDIAKLKNGKDWKSLSVGDVPVYGSGGAMGEFVSEYAYNKPTVLIPRKGSISNLFYLEKPFWNVDTIYYTEIDDSQVVPRYLYYYLTTIDLESMATNPTRPSLTQAILDKIPIPVPSLPIQQRIVQVLDNFDAVCNDLNIGLPKEIELRQKQYEYFREKLLTFTAEGVYTDSTVQYSTVQYRQDLIRLLNWVFGPIRVELGAVASYGNQKISTGDLSPKRYIGVDNLLQNRAGKLDATYLPEMVKVNIYEEGNILIGNIRPYLKKIWFATNSGGASPDVLVVQNQVKDCLVNRYLYHILANDRFFEFDMQNAKGSKMPRGDKGAVLHYQFILPTFSDQFRIVAILDKFDELTTSISQGLPKEIELRQKQYEYFRDTLLNFPNKYE